MKHTLTMLALASVAAVGLAPQSLAYQDHVTIEVQSGLSTAAEQEAILDEIKAASRRVCRTNGLVGVRATQIEFQCRDTAYENAVRQLNRIVADNAQKGLDLAEVDARITVSQS